LSPDGTRLRRGRDGGRFHRIHARHHGERHGEHGGGGREVRPGPARVPRRADGGCVLHRLHERDHHHAVRQLAELREGSTRETGSGKQETENGKAGSRVRRAAAASGWQPLIPAGCQLPATRIMMMQLSRDAAWALMTEWTQSESLRRHMLAVEAAVRGYARLFGEDEDAWGIVGLLHDFDYERYPDPADHPFRGVEVLRSLGYPDWVTRAILSHADYSGVPRESRLEKTLFACDEMTGFITAAALVRPSRSV